MDRDDRTGVILDNLIAQNKAVLMLILQEGGSARKVTGLKNVWGTAFQGVHDHVYVRAIVLDNGQTGAALVSID